MTSHHPYLAHHFEDIQQQRQTTSLGMWVFLATEVMFFGGLLVAYAVYRWRFPAAFAEGSHHLSLTLGAINTGLLLVSSFTVVLAVDAAHANRRKAIIVFLLLTMLLGTAFLGIKVIEYGEKFDKNLVPGANFRLEEVYHEAAAPPNVEVFFSMYFALTGLHALHMIIGLGIFVYLIAAAWRGHVNKEHFEPVEYGGLYWHFVDIVWVFLFPLLYLV